MLLSNVPIDDVHSSSGTRDSNVPAFGQVDTSLNLKRHWFILFSSLNSQPVTIEGFQSGIEFHMSQSLVYKKSVPKILYLFLGRIFSIGTELQNSFDLQAKSGSSSTLRTCKVQDNDSFKIKSFEGITFKE